MAATRRTTGQILGDRLVHYRERAGLTQEKLADRMAELGHPMNRVTIAKIESAARPRVDGKAPDRTRAENAALTDVLMLAAALDVPPVLLFVPLGQDEEIELGGQRVHPHLMLDWLAGDAPLASLPKNRPVGSLQLWRENAEVVDLFRDLRRFQDRAARAQADLDSIRSRATEDELARANVVVDVRLRDLGQHLRSMRSAGIESLPALSAAWVTRIAELELEDDR